MKKDFPCLCGHECKDHEVWLRDPAYPNHVLLGPCQLGLDCECDVFRPDNLKYLEDIRESKLKHK